MDDRELAAACADGDESAWLELIRRHDRKVLHVLWQSGARARDELDDLRQEVWVRLLSRNGASLRGFRADHPGALRVFIGRVARSVAIDHGRNRKPSAPEEHAADVVDPRPAPDVALDHARVGKALDRVAAEGENPARDRDILRLHFEQGYSPAEIAEMGLGLSARGVEAVLRRARDRLAELLNPGASPAALPREHLAEVDPARLREALDALAAASDNPARDRDILRLHFEQGCAASEIAEMGLGLSAAEVEAVLRPARERLAALLKEQS